MQVVVIIAFVLFAAVVLIGGFMLAARRRREMAAVAAQMGLRFSAWDPFRIPRRHGRMLVFSRGRGRRAYNVIYGEVDGRSLIVSDYRYTVGSGKNSHTYRRTYCLLYTGGVFNDLQVRPENFMDKVAGWVGFDDIDFEYGEFNDEFFVRCDSKKFAYDIIYPKMMEYMLENRGLYMEMSGEVILVHYNRKLKPAQIGPIVRVVQEINRLLPTYLKGAAHFDSADRSD